MTYILTSRQSPSLGNFPLFVHPGCPGDNYLQCSYSGATRATERIENSTMARPGYFSIALNNSVGYEMTAAMHTTLFRFSIPDQGEMLSSNGIVVPNSPVLLLDLTDLGGTRRGGEIQVDPESGRMTGSGKFSPSFGHGQYSAYFCADFKGANIRKTGTFVNTKANETVKGMGRGSSSESTMPVGSAGGFVQFDRPSESRFLARVGLSFMSVAQACQNAEREIPDFDFDSVVEASKRAWSEKLSVIEVDQAGVNEDLLTTFWSGFYRALLSPQDYTGENPLWNSSEPYFDSFYCIWDSFRAQHPLLTLVDPKEQTRMVRALIDIYKHEGKLPDCRMSFAKGYTQGGSNGDVVLADAFLKNLHEGIDWNLGYEAVVSDAEVEPEDWTSIGRGNLEAWKTYGFIPNDDDDDKNYTGPQTRTVSRTVEYAYEDFTIALMARGLGREDDERKYLERSKNWENVFDPDAKDQYTDGGRGVVGSDFTGFMQPRSRNGAFTYQNMRLCSPVYEMHKCYFDTVYDTYEGSPWLYTFYVPQDMASLILRLGGKETFIDRLSYFHSSGIIYMGNEQCRLHIPLEPRSDFACAWHPTDIQCVFQLFSQHISSTTAVGPALVRIGCTSTSRGSSTAASMASLATMTAPWEPSLLLRSWDSSQSQDKTSTCLRRRSSVKSIYKRPRGRGRPFKTLGSIRRTRPSIYKKLSLMGSRTRRTGSRMISSIAAAC